MHARYYSPAIGHFLIPDTVLPNPGDSLSYDRYAYVRNNPIMFTDPSGHNPMVLLAFVLIGAAVGGIVAAINQGNILIGMLAGAISGAMAYYGSIGSSHVWAHFAVTQSVNVALHATSGGQWLIRQVGDAIGSQVLGDMLVSALATGATLRAFHVSSVPEGTKLSAGQPAGRGRISALSGEANNLDAAAAATEDSAGNLALSLHDEMAASAKIQELREKAGMWSHAAEQATDFAKRQQGMHNSRFGQDTATAVYKGRVGTNDVMAFFDASWSSTRSLTAIDVKAVGFDAPVLIGRVSVGPVASHTTASSPLASMENPYPGWSYATGTGVCHQSTALGLSKTLGVSITPFDLTSNWTAMLSTGLYGYHGIYGGLLWRGAEQYGYEQASR